MKGDFTRDTFKAEKHYQHVLMQQGRVQLDADWNEQAAIASRRHATTAVDVVGHCGGPAEPAAFGAFTNPAQLSPRDRERLTALFGSRPAAQQPVDVSGGTFGLKQPGDFFLSPGRYYVHGVQCENAFATPYTAQPDRRDAKPLTPPASGQPKFFLIYLDVWHRHLSALDDPGMREPALGGPDTGTRVKTVWQVRHVDMGAPDGTSPCGTPVTAFDRLLAVPTARLSAMTALAAASDDPCEVPERAGYKGLENQLYRVEINQGSADAGGNATEPTWKWSRENGSVAAQILRIAGT